MNTISVTATFRHQRQLRLQLTTALLASLLLMAAGQVPAQTATAADPDRQGAQAVDTGTTSQTGPAQADAKQPDAKQPDTKQADKPANRKPKRDKAAADERELEEEEDI